MAESEQKVTPWEARAAEGAAKIDFDKLIREIRIQMTARLSYQRQVSLEV